MSENWNHSICDPCWDHMNPGSTATRHNPGEDKKCCFCQTWHDSGIFVRMHPKNIKHHIDHYDDDDDGHADD